MNIKYIQDNAHPTTLFIAGMHGDEYESGKIFSTLVSDFTNYLYIQEASPSAIILKTRRNIYNNDLNRAFVENPTDPEAREIITIIKNKKFNIAIDIHEDPDRTNAYYVYDSKHMTDDQLHKYRQIQNEASLYSGIDDFDDEHLRLLVDRGYVSLPYTKPEQEAGFFIRWAIEHEVVQRGFTIEIPGKATSHLKKNILQTVIPYLLTV